MSVNQNDCRACGGWGCGACRPRVGEQADVEMRERDEAIAAAVTAEREACAQLAEARIATLESGVGLVMCRAIAADIRRRGAA